MTTIFSRLVSINLLLNDLFSKVTGTSFFLWVLECYPTLTRHVETLMTEVTEYTMYESNLVYEWC